MNKGVFYLYRCLSCCLYPLIWLYLNKRRLKGKENPKRWREKLGFYSQAKPKHPVIWCHAVSVGETKSILPLLERIHQAYPKLSILLTTGTLTSATMLEKDKPSFLIHQFNPIDSPQVVRRFWRHWQPQLLLMVESEWWPNWLYEAERHGIKALLLNARLSEHSYQRWYKKRGLAKIILEKFDLITTPSARYQTWLQELGAPENSVQVVGHLKYATPPLDYDPAKFQALKMLTEGRTRWMAASTHPGEEEMIIAIHQKLRQQWPDLLTIIVPRHPERAASIRQIAAQKGLSVCQRSVDEVSQAATVDIYLADTMNELGLFYRLCPIVFVGGSLVPKGGQNILEPAQLGCAIIHGPYMDNFHIIVEDFDRAGAITLAQDQDQLFQTLHSWLANPTLVKEKAGIALWASQTHTSVLDDYLALLKPYLDKVAP